MTILITLSVLLLIFALLLFTTYPVDVVFLAGVTLLLLFKVLTINEAFSGLTNESVLTVAILFVLVAGLKDTGAVSWIGSVILRKPKSESIAFIRLTTLTAMLSAFMNNTPLVATMVPVLKDWCKKNQLATSKFMIPLSFATVLGGLVTLIGTSTNMVVNGLVIKAAKEGVKGLETYKQGLDLFSPLSVGGPLAILGLIYLFYIGRKLLPDNKTSLSAFEDTRNYTVEMLVDAKGPLLNKTIEDAGLRNLPGLYLVEIIREEKIVGIVSPTETLKENDRLIFVGIVESVLDLQKIRGLVPATDQVFKLDTPRTLNQLYEAVVSDIHPLIGKTIKSGQFRSRYNAAVLSVARSGQRLNQKVGDVVLKAGDILLIESHKTFIEKNQFSKDYFLISPLQDSVPIRHDKAWIAISILVLFVFLATTEIVPILIASMLCAGLMILTRCCYAHSARKNIDIALVITIACSFALSRAIEKTGMAESFVQHMVSFLGTNPHTSLFVLYAITVLLSEAVTNNAAAAFMFPIGLATAQQLSVSPMPFVIACMMGASCAFATPLGYQTHLMVQGPGGYTFKDFVKVGVFLDIILAVAATLIIPLAWPF